MSISKASSFAQIALGLALLTLVPATASAGKRIDGLASRLRSVPTRVSRSVGALRQAHTAATASIVSSSTKENARDATILSGIYAANSMIWLGLIHAAAPAVGLGVMTFESRSSPSSILAKDVPRSKAGRWLTT